MSSTNFRIEPLNADNYETWKLHMRSILIKNDLWAYADGRATFPKEEAERAIWRATDQKACADIMLSISASELGLVSECLTSHDMMKKLENTFQSRGPAKKATLLKRVALAHLKEGECVRDHLNIFFESVKKLKNIGVQIGDDLLAILLLYSVPPSFENFRCALESRDDLPRPDALRVKILEEDESRKASVERSEQNALFAHKSDKKLVSQNKSNDYKRSGTCFKCGKLGHYARNCKSRTNKASAQYNRKNGSFEPGYRHDTVLYSTESTFLSADMTEKLCLDSGCTSHMSANAGLFTNLKKENKTLQLANNKTTDIKGVGDIKLIGKEKCAVTLKDVLYVSDLRTNLLSVSKATDKGYEVRFYKSSAKVIDNFGNVVCVAERIGNLYFLKQYERVANISEQQEQLSGIDLWHQKLGHLNERDLKVLMSDKLAFGLNFKTNENLKKCETCISEKQVREIFPKSADKTNDFLQIVHSDVCGPFKYQSLSGARYFVTFIDNYSRWCEVYFLKQKSDVFNAFKMYKAAAELKTGNKIKAFQSDNGKEYVNREFNLFFDECGIKRRLTVPYTPQQNGVAERKNRTLVEMARCMMKQAGAPASFWAEAINTACYIRNRCPTKSLNGAVPHKLWSNKIPTLIHLKVFGSKAYVLNKTPKSKFESRSHPCIFVGYSAESKAYRLWCPKNRDVIVSRDVKFLNQSGFKNESTYIDTENHTIEFLPLTPDTPVLYRNTVGDSVAEQGDTPSKQNDRAKIQAVQRRGRGRGRPKRTLTGKKGRPKKVYQKTLNNNNKAGENDINYSNDEPDDDEHESANLALEDEPTSLTDALKTDDAPLWISALDCEYKAQLRNCTWQIVERPACRKIIGSKFVFKTKDSGAKNVRLVAKGCSQRPGEDFYETFSPVVRSTSIRMLAALSAEMGLEIHQMDVVAAYLNGDLCDTVYMEIPENLQNFLDHFISSQQNNTPNSETAETVKTAEKWLRALNQVQNGVCLLKKALYGLKQSGFRWYQKLSATLLENGLEPSTRDPCLFIEHRDVSTLIVAVYVDDLLIASNDRGQIDELKSKLSNKFDMKDMGRVKTCLGIQFYQQAESRHVFMSQENYIKTLLQRFNMLECKICPTPLEANCKLQRPTKINEDVMNKLPYQKLIGSLMYLAVSTRPDIAFAENYLSQFNSNYEHEHWQAAKRILRYLKGTSKLGLFFQKTNKALFAVVDSDWAGDLNDRRSYTGFGFIFAGSVISWEARKQKTQTNYARSRR